MKILVAPDAGSDLFADSQDNREAWNVDSIKLWNPQFSPDEIVNEALSDNGPLTVFMPAVLNSENALAYDGADLALQVLFRMLAKGLAGMNIVLLGTETELAFMRHYSYPNIIKIPGISYRILNQKIVSGFKPLEITLAKPAQYLPYLDNLGLKLPPSFKSTHSLTNEWSLYKWSQFIEYNTEDDALNGILYIDYLKTIEHLNRIKNKTASDGLYALISKLPGNRRILLIDDNKGWHSFFDHLLATSGISFDAIGENFNKKSEEEIRGIIMNKIEEFNPHVILLDFRLLEDADTDVSSPDKISGNKILQILKGSFEKPGESFGRQIIVFSATSRIENILMLSRNNADGFILKEKPGLYTGKGNTRDIVCGLVRTIGKAIERADYLIPLNERLNRLCDVVKAHANNYGDALKDLIDTTAKSVRQITQGNDLTSDVLKLAYLDIFQIFEEIKRDSGFIRFPNKFTLRVKAHQWLTVCERGRSGMRSRSDDDWNYRPQFNMQTYDKYCSNGGNMNFAICALILFRLGYSQVDDTAWNEVRKTRNDLAHGKDNRHEQIPVLIDEETLKNLSLKMLDLIIRILDPHRISQVIPQLSQQP